MNYWIHTPVLSTMTLIMASLSLAAEEVYRLDFQHEDGVKTKDYKIVSSGAGTLKEFKPKPIALGSDCQLVFELTEAGTSVTTFDPGESASMPLVKDGWAFNGDSGEYSEDPIATFKLTGLRPRSRVTLYAITAWDGPGRAALISLERREVVDLAASNAKAGVEPIVPDDFVLVAKNVTVPQSGELIGRIYEDEADQAQLGGMIIEVKDR
jgi:hypothetical protein